MTLPKRERERERKKGKRKTNEKHPEKKKFEGVYFPTFFSKVVKPDVESILSSPSHNRRINLPLPDICLHPVCTYPDIMSQTL